MKLRVKGQSGREIGLSFGNQQRDYTYSQYIDFMKVEDRYLRESEEFLEFEKKQKEEEVDDKEWMDIMRKKLYEGKDNVDKVIEMLSYVVECDDWGEIPFNIDGMELEKKWRNGKIGSVFEEVSIVRLYFYLTDLFNGNEEERLVVTRKWSFEFNDDVYWIEPDRALRVMSEGKLKTYTVLEFIEVSETERWLDKEIKEKGDLYGELEFERELRVLAVLLRKEGEELPINVRERKKWIENRAKSFQRMPMDVVLGVRFFLSSIWEGFKMSLFMVHSGGEDLRQALGLPPTKLKLKPGEIVKGKR